ncbi:hypothetical protein [Herbaspirillum sp.]|uniref:hypothetical protein n=1 Tax=Herbaspirillum sp. TaxID=1890675 RepID=UPI0031D1CBA8
MEKRLRLEFILGRGQINLKAGAVISVSASNNFICQHGKKKQKPLKYKGNALFDGHLVPLRVVPTGGRHSLICWR